MGRTLRRTAAITALWRALTSSSRGGADLSTKLSATPRMLWQTMRGRYDGLGRLLLMVGAAAYVISPVDFAPELLLGPLGLIDDTIIVAWIAGTFLAESERFLSWESGGRTVHGEYLDGEVA
jgi:uncharacterized membrane protein YkvA (DUF1232 family)